MKNALPALKDWANSWLESRRLKPSSRRSYQREVERFIAWCERRGVVTCAQVVEALIDDYWHDLTSTKLSACRRLGIGKPLAAGSRTQCRRIASLMLREGVQTTAFSPAILASLVRSTSEGTKVAQSRRPLRFAIQAVNRISSDCAISEVQRLTVDLAFWCGATPGEMAQMRWRDVRVANGRAHVHMPWGGRSELSWFELPVQPSSNLTAYRAREPRSRDDAIFPHPTDSARSVTPRTIARWIKVAAHAAKAAQLGSSRSLRNVFVLLARERRWRESEIACRIRRSRTSPPSPPSAQFPGRDLLRLLERPLK